MFCPENETGGPNDRPAPTQRKLQCVARCVAIILFLELFGQDPTRTAGALASPTTTGSPEAAQNHGQPDERKKGIYRGKSNQRSPGVRYGGPHGPHGGFGEGEEPSVETGLERVHAEDDQFSSSDRFLPVFRNDSVVEGAKVLWVDNHGTAELAQNEAGEWGFNYHLDSAYSSDAFPYRIVDPANEENHSDATVSLR